ncbi:positive regulator of sigma(E), RseC/MucC [Vibrio xiamenensis]|uniref:Positive regulator of sigma(E), RseC/MucC n=1 Tax=Vibrio xiamenensis TaxID=861298 RepID=A0A1G7VWZ4_9VIBR|nr:SoxR reducing system RseC family protein [Vibrio xiamenensis]SDG64237.1 positive regulator of sigma(E), RseC/MucC [Vibrio xiamenensis]
MMTALATVSAVTTQSDGFEVELSCEQKTSCSSCASQKSCGTGIVSKAVGSKALNWTLQTNKLVKIGQIVEIGFPERSLILSAMVVYIVPLVAMILGAVIGQWWLAPLFSGGEGVIIASSALFVGLGMMVAKRLARTLEAQSGQDVVLVRVLGEPIS